MRKLLKGDCLERLKELPDGRIDCVIADPPYGTTACKWDSIIPLDAMWAELLRVCKPNAAICLFASQPFTSALVMSQPKLFRYTWVWEKSVGTGHLDAKKKPLKCHEDIAVFYRAQATYNPQRYPGPKNHTANVDSVSGNAAYGAHRHVQPDQSGMKYPRSVQCFDKFSSRERLHPTQKPVDLCAYLVRTYTDPGETVLDFCMGSGTTGVAAIREGRDFVGIERDEGYYATARERVLAEVAKLTEVAAAD
jgi:DNA modification methylase